MMQTILSSIGWVGAALVFAAFIGGMIRTEWQEAWVWTSRAGLGLLAVYLASQWRELARLLRGRQARYGSLSLASIAAVIGILVAINYIGARQNRRWDLTAAGQFTLSDQTVRVLESLEQPVNVLVFGRDDDFDRFRARLTEYEYITDRVGVEYIDIDKQPVRARQYQVQSYGTVVFEYADRVERVVADTEQELTNTLIKVVEGEERRAYFLTGHGEKSPDSAERDGYNAVAEALAGDNFMVDSLVLAQEGTVPDDASVVVVAGPRTDLLPGEIDALRSYLRGGGKALFLLDPNETEESPPHTNVRALLAEWSIELGEDVVVDVSGIGQLIGTDASVPVAASYPPHPITERFQLLTAFPLARSVQASATSSEGPVPQPFVETGARSWAELDVTGLVAGDEVVLDEEAGDRPGPITIGVAVAVPVEEAASEVDGAGAVDESSEAEPPDAAAGQAGSDDQPGDPEDSTPAETRVAVIGDSDFAANFGLGIQGNLDLFLNTVNWLAQQENLIAIRPREPEDRRITLTAQQQRRVFWVSIFLLPGIVFGSGVYTWWQRR